MTTSTRLLGAGAALLAGALLSACGEPAPELPPLPPPVPAAVAATPSPEAGPAAATAGDTAFVQQVLARHQQVVDLAGLATARASSAEARALAEDVVRAHGWEMTEAATWLQARGSLPADVAATPPPGEAEDVAALVEAEPAAFDRMFLDLLAQHHRATVELARAEQRDGRDAEARTLAWLVDEGRTGELERITALQQAP